MYNKLILQAKEDYKWYICNIDCTAFPLNNNAIKYAQKVFDDALIKGNITELEHKKLCLSLPFELGVVK